MSMVAAAGVGPGARAGARRARAPLVFCIAASHCDDSFFIAMHQCFFVLLIFVNESFFLVFQSCI